MIFTRWASSVGVCAILVVGAHEVGAVELSVSKVGTPVKTARADDARVLARTADGGWNFITHFLSPKNPTEAVVVNLTSGVQKTFERPVGAYADGCVSPRAANQRIFFTEYSKNNVSYYEPSNESIVQLGTGPVTDGGDLGVFRWVYGSNGMLYGGSQTTVKPAYRPYVIEINPTTLAKRTVGLVGQVRNSYSFAYYLAPDPPWIYVAVGQDPWELVALNLGTGEHRVLATKTAPSFMQFSAKPQGWTVTMIDSNDVREYRWVVDGTTYPWDAGQPVNTLPFTPRSVAAAGRDVSTDEPKLDTSRIQPDSQGVARFKYQLPGSTVWRDASAKVNYLAPYDIESLIELPDKTLLGNGRSYTGFFRYAPDSGTFTTYGAYNSLSGGDRVVVDGLVYMSGYPNGALVVYDPTKPWTASESSSTTDNPASLGNFYPTTDAKYAGPLLPTDAGRLYFTGRRERSGVGAGIGYYEIATKKFVGHYRPPLGYLLPRGLADVQTGARKRFVFSRQLIDDPGATTPKPAQAELQVFDEELAEVDRIVVDAGLLNTGSLFPGAPGEVVGVLTAPTSVVYRVDVAAKALRAWKKTGTLQTLWRDDVPGTLVLLIDGVATRLDLATLALTPIAPLGIDAGVVPENFVSTADGLYYSVTSELFVARWNPRAYRQTVTTLEGESVAIALAGHDTQGRPLSFNVTLSPSHGQVTGTAPALTYYPHAGYVGPDTFAFTVTSGTATSNPATVNINVVAHSVGQDAGPSDAGTVAHDGGSIASDGGTAPPVTSGGCASGGAWTSSALAFVATWALRRRRRFSP